MKSVNCTILDRLTNEEELRSGVMLETTTEIFQNVVQKSYLEAIDEADEEEQQRELFNRAAFKTKPWFDLLIGWHFPSKA